MRGTRERAILCAPQRQDVAAKIQIFPTRPSALGLFIHPSFGRRLHQMGGRLHQMGEGCTRWAERLHQMDVKVALDERKSAPDGCEDCIRCVAPFHRFSHRCPTFGGFSPTPRPKNSDVCRKISHEILKKSNVFRKNSDEILKISHVFAPLAQRFFSFRCHSSK